MLGIDPEAVPLLVFGIVTDQVVAEEPAPENMLDIFVTLEVFQEERFRVKVVELEPASENMAHIEVTLEVFQEERFKVKVVELWPARINMKVIFSTLEVFQEAMPLIDQVVAL